jgi:hypothetical protein
MCFRLWERSTCGSTDLDAKGKGVINFGCRPSADRCGGPELMLIQKEATSPPLSLCNVRVGKAVQQYFVCLLRS